MGCVPGRHTPAGKSIGGNVFTILHTAVFRKGGFTQPASATTTLNVGETTDMGHFVFFFIFFFGERQRRNLEFIGKIVLQMKSPRN